MILNFAHRGSLTEAPENTLPAFHKAINNGAKALELDVQLSKDNHLVVCHDYKFFRFNKGVEGQINDYTFEEIKQIDVGKTFGEEFKGVTLPALEEVLEICPADLLLNIEIKNIPVIYEGIEQILLNTLTEYHRLNNLIISSFDHAALKRVQEINSEIPLGMLFYYRILNPWNYAKTSGLNIRSIHPNHVYVDQTFVHECKRNGYSVYPFTVSDMERYEQLLEYGVDGVFSNNPKIFGE
ncbi:glycerophosphoryl diester phosphodiesterase [Virgibacillus subterraneus]|uniref:Glycerophosphoryl diester phosphodiesterase n=1 Tax=Virgibacillus subterraneus TaxID=621109 RepID=A0A1H9AFL8_9BACI|nr:glycerophosphodiester phosphodiesterase family protein [Virgibacillus subterraneus]SEP75534.1 glycerophosphoryl diester phosphodiesterase [Virgibacillus subterraneus]